MGAIEQITATDKIKRDPLGRQYIVKQWNPTVANLTLMALGSSAPEIILSLIEILKNNMYAGDLGPGTIVGSAAFNLMFIFGICTAAIPNPKDDTLFHDKDGNILPGAGVRRIKEMSVYLLTGVFSVLAYLWLVVILIGPSPNAIHPWEGAATFCLFPLLVILAYILDHGCGTHKLNKVKDVENAVEELSCEGGGKRKRPSMNKFFTRASVAEPHDVARAIKAHSPLRSSAQSQTAEEAAAMLTEQYDLKPRTLQSRAGYRRLATNKHIAGKSAQIKEILGPGTTIEGTDGKSMAAEIGRAAEISIANVQYTCMEDCGSINLTVTRNGNVEVAVAVDYVSEDDTAKSGIHFECKEGTLNFAAGEATKLIHIDILNNTTGKKLEYVQGDLIYDISFVVRLTHPRIPARLSVDDASSAYIRNDMCIVTIVDDDSEGYLTLETDKYRVMENHGTLRCKIVRKGGGKGEVSCAYTTMDKTAVASKPGAPGDYVHCSGRAVFKNAELEYFVNIPIVNDETYERDETFYLDISAVEGGAHLGSIKRAEICIENDDKMASWLDRVTSMVNLNRNHFKLGASSYGQQFKDATRWPKGHSDKVVHVIMVPWKVMGAIIPPPRVMGGWPCFGFALGFIGLVTALIGDLAGLFGCVVGLSDQVTAITFVALGTSLPDTFASRMAAVHEKTADAAITNVTGSNSVNVFLGLGLSWMIAACYWYGNATEEWALTLGIDGCGVVYDHPEGIFFVKSGGLVFSVIVFCLCACVTFVVLAVRRLKVGGELGGPGKEGVAVGLCSLWFLYILLSALYTEEVILKHFMR
jgi:solute carrier family 8 (sodium/calcium exchanger)